MIIGIVTACGQRKISEEEVSFTIQKISKDSLRQFKELYIWESQCHIPRSNSFYPFSEKELDSIILNCPTSLDYPFNQLIDMGVNNGKNCLIIRDEKGEILYREFEIN